MQFIFPLPISLEATGFASEVLCKDKINLPLWMRDFPHACDDYEPSLFAYWL